MDENSFSQFWREKERLHQSTLILASTAEYLGGYHDIPAPISGLLYLMKNGIYFENLKDSGWWRSVFRTAFRIENNFTPINIELRTEHIIDVSCFRGQKYRERLTFGEKLALFFGFIPRRLLIEYREAGEKLTVAFKCDKPPIQLCAAFYNGLKESRGLAGGFENQ